MANVKPLKISANGKISQIADNDSLNVSKIIPAEGNDTGTNLAISAGDAALTGGSLYLDAGLALDEEGTSGSIYLGRNAGSSVIIDPPISCSTINLSYGGEDGSATLTASALQIHPFGLLILNPDGDAGILSYFTDSGANHIQVQPNTTLSTFSTGNINLPNNGLARFKIENIAVGTKVTAVNLTTLTDGVTVNDYTSNADALHHHAMITVRMTAGEVLTNGTIVGLENSSGSPRCYPAASGAVGNRHFAVGVSDLGASIGVLVDIVVCGEKTIQNILWISVPTASDIGAYVYLSSTPGKVTLTPPSGSGEYVQKIGTVTFAGGAVNTTRVLIQIGSSTLNP